MCLTTRVSSLKPIFIFRGGIVNSDNDVDEIDDDDGPITLTRKVSAINFVLGLYGTGTDFTILCIDVSLLADAFYLEVYLGILLCSLMRF